MLLGGTRGVFTRITLSGAAVDGNLPQAGFYMPTIGALGISTAGLPRGTIDALGQWILNAPSSGSVALTVNGASSAVALQVTGPISNLSTGVPAFVANSVGANFGQLFTTGANAWALGYGASTIAIGTAVVKWTSSGNVSVLSPASGVALSVVTAPTTTIGMLLSGGGTSTGAVVQYVDGQVGQRSWYAGVGISLIGAWSVVDATVGTEKFRVTGGAGGRVLITDSSANLIYNAGFLELPQQIQNGNYTTTLADSGKSIVKTASGGVAYAIGILAYPLGTVLTIVNDNAAGNITLNSGTDTVVWSPSGTATTGSVRIIGPNGIATLFRSQAARWVLTGTNIS